MGVLCVMGTDGAGRSKVRYVVVSPLLFRGVLSAPKRSPVLG